AREAGVIENVVKLRPELHVQVFIHLGIFKNDPVEIGEAIEPDSVAPQSSDISKQRLNQRVSAGVPVRLTRLTRVCVDASRSCRRYARRRRTAEWSKHEFADITHNCRSDKVDSISGQ